MTDRVNALIVVLEKDTRVDDIEVTIAAIKQLRRVLTVTGNVADYGEYVAYERVKRELGQKLWEVLYPKDDK